MRAESVDSIVTDPPYEIGFMGKGWDRSGIATNVEMWTECLRVLKPGGHLLAFGGSRTYHRLASAVEDAGFEIRDQIMWLYGQGFPKSLDVSKAMDKAATKQEPAGVGDHEGNVNFGMKNRCPMCDKPYFSANPCVCPKVIDGRRVVGIDRERAARLVNQTGEYTTDAGWSAGNRSAYITEPMSEDAAKWDGWGTALKPAHEPIVVARKPLIGTVVANVLKHGTGAINIKACRVGTEAVPSNQLEVWSGFGKVKRPEYTQVMNEGRWPANVIHDGSEEVLAHFPESKDGVAVRHRSGGNNCHTENPKPPMVDMGYGGAGSASRFFKDCGNGREGEASAERRYTEEGGTNFAMTPGARRFDEGTAARFFYCAKAGKKDRNEGCDELEDKDFGQSNAAKAALARGETYANSGNGMNSTKVVKNNHPTVKPTALMRYLIRLVTPPGGTVLDPFMGSGSTGKAAVLEGFGFIGIDMSQEYVAIAAARIAAAEKQILRSAQDDKQLKEAA